MPRDTYALLLSATQLHVVHEALTAAAAAGQGSFRGMQRWWGDEGGHGHCLKGQLEALTKKMCGLHPRRIHEAPEEARIAWDIISALSLSWSAMRLKRAPDYASLPRLSKEPPARLDRLHGGDRSQGSLRDLEKIPLARVLPPLRVARAAAVVAVEHPMTDHIENPKKPKTVTLLKKRGKK